MNLIVPSISISTNGSARNGTRQSGLFKGTARRKLNGRYRIGKVHIVFCTKVARSENLDQRNGDESRLMQETEMLGFISWELFGDAW